MAAPRPIQTARLTLPGLLVLALFVGACAGGTGASSAPAASNEPPEASTPPASASGAATEAPTAQATIAPDADLAALLPTTVAGTEWTVTSHSGEPPLNINDGGIAGPVGVDPSDIEYAVAVGPDSDYRLGHLIYAIRFTGADSAAIMEGTPVALGGIFFQAGSIEVTEETIGGKEISVLPSGGEALTTYYYYVIGDVLFLVQTPDRAEAEDALAQLP